MKKILPLLFVALAASGIAFAKSKGNYIWNSQNQGDPDQPYTVREVLLPTNPLSNYIEQSSSTINLQLKDIAINPARINVGTNVLTVIEFPDDIIQVASARPDFLNTQISEASKAQLLVRGNKSGASTDLLITLASGETAMFIVKIDATRNVPMRYVVKGNDAAAPAPVTTNTPSSPVEWLGVKTDYNAFDNGDVIINYSVFNKSVDAGILASSTALNFYTTENGVKKSLDYKITRDSTNGGVIAAGKAEYGLIKVMGANTISPLTMEWTITNQKSRQKVTYKTEMDLSNGTSR